MRTFDYRRLPHQLLDSAVADANVRVYEDKGRLDLLKETHPEHLASLREQAHFDTVEASAHIEGLYVETTRARAVAGGEEPLDETEAQVAGYSQALRLIEEDPRNLELSTATIVKLFETLYAHRDLGRRSRYRKKDYLYVQVDGHMQAMPVSPIAAFETPLVLGGACDSLASVFSPDARNPLVLNAVFTVDFLCIRPFDEGNGRISRLFSDLMLEKAGFDIARYVSVDRIIEGSAMDYYDALNACVERWERGMNDYSPFALYWLGVVHEAHQQLFAKVRTGTAAPGGKSERVRSFIMAHEGTVNKRFLLETFPDISEATIESVLGKMVKAGELSKEGAGRSTSYRIDPKTQEARI